MPSSDISGDSLYLIQVATLCSGPAVTCGPDAGLVEIARTMRDHDVSGLIVLEQNQPVGMVSLNDIRDFIAETGTSPVTCRAGDLMTPGVVTIRQRAPVFEAIFQMARHNVKRLAVVDENGNPVGVVSDTDLLRLQTCTPLYLNQEIEAAQSVEQLARVCARIPDIIRNASHAGASPRSLVELIAHFNDTFTQRTIALMESDEGLRLPAGAAYLVLGSQGRGEQTLRTDQDSAIIYSDTLSAEQLEEVSRFSTRLCAALDQIGIPRCPGETMASNPLWRRSLGEWKRLIDQWVSVLKPDNMVNFGMFQDFRVLHGDREFGRQLTGHIRAHVERNSLFLAYVARHITGFKPPMGIFGRLRVERRGKYRGQLDLKKAGIFAITEGASLLGLEAGIVNGTTWDKLERLEAQGILSAADAETFSDALSYLVYLRLQSQLRAIAAGHELSNHIDPLLLTGRERDRLREALRGVGAFLRMLRDHFQLELIAR
jgi:CBS domain-containing protein